MFSLVADDQNAFADDLTHHQTIQTVKREHSQAHLQAHFQLAAGCLAINETANRQMAHSNQCKQPQA